MAGYNYPEGSMMGSGIYADEFEYEAFECENPDCDNKHNEAQTVVTNDWGDWEVVCQNCEVTHETSTDGEVDYDPAEPWMDKD
jgi:hypothetical protein